LRQLRCLVALADCGNFTRGAAAMGVSQPSFSQQIHVLEGLLGGAVAERGGRAVLTPLGREAVAAARRVLAEAEGFADLARRHREGELAGTLRLGVSPTLGPYILPQLVARLHATHPTLKVHVREGCPMLCSIIWQKDGTIPCCCNCRWPPPGSMSNACFVNRCFWPWRPMIPWRKCPWCGPSIWPGAAC
jgi:hypothetical protein